MKVFITRILIAFSIVTLNTIVSFSQANDCICDQCVDGDEPECRGFTPDECPSNTPECGGIPINENSYLLMAIGGILVLVSYTVFKRQKASAQSA